MSDAALRMDRMYGWQKHIYDLTRKPYLLGRDQLIANLAPPKGGRLLEIGCGTGRNLILAAQRWPDANFCGFDISEEMLDKARANIARAGLANRISLACADATCFDTSHLFDHRHFDRIFLSYTLSMIPEWTITLRNAIECLAPGGAIMIADFGDQNELPLVFKAVLRRWLSLFHVTPRNDLQTVLEAMARDYDLAADFVPVYRRYAFLAVLRSCSAPGDRAGSR